MSENSKNATLESIKNKLNEISLKLFGHNDCSCLIEGVDTSKLGKVMIENLNWSMKK